MSQVRIGFVGAGNMGQCAHLRNYATLADCRVVALAERRPRLARAVAQRYGIPRVYPSHQEMLAAERLDGIVASQPFTRHGTLLPELLAAGVPVFIEKPLAGSIAQGQRVLDAAQAGGAWLMVGYHKRCDPATRAAKAEIQRLAATGELGRLRYIRATMPAGDWVAGGFFDRLDTGEKVELDFDPPAEDLDRDGCQAYLAFVNYYIHQVNLLRHLLGEPYRVTHADPAGVLMVGQSDSGVTVALEMTPYHTTVDWQESALIAFEKGHITLELPAPLAINRPGRVVFFRDPGEGAAPQRLEPQLPWSHAMREQAQAFLDAIRGLRPPPCQAAEALEDLKLAREYLRLWKGI